MWDHSFLKFPLNFLRSLGTSFKNGLAWDESKKDTLVATQPMNKAKIKTMFEESDRYCVVRVMERHFSPKYSKKMENSSSLEIN